MDAILQATPARHVLRSRWPWLQRLRRGN